MLTWLYVPGDRPDRFAKAVASGTDAVILDLEDAVHPERKAYARRAVAEFCADQHDVPVQVRINALGSEAASDDLAALVPVVGVGGFAGLRLPKVESPADVRDLAAGLPATSLLCL